MIVLGWAIHLSLNLSRDLGIWNILMGQPWVLHSQLMLVSREEGPSKESVMRRHITLNVETLALPASCPSLFPVSILIS